jgi:hypothetical protein
MNKKVNMADFMNNSLLDTIYKEREDSLYQNTNTDTENIKEINKNNPITYEDLLVAIKNLPPHFNNTREFILERLEGYLKRQNSLTAYDNEKFYKSGFCDGVQLVLEALEKGKKII